MWVTADDLKAAAGLDPADSSDDAWLGQTVAAVNDLVARLRPDLRPGFDRFEFDGAFETPVTDAPAVRQGALELGLKMYRARGATDDTGSYDLYNYAARYLDANVRFLLGIDGPVIA